MSVLILPRRFRSQPQYPAPIDYEGLGKGMQLLFNPAIGPVDIVTKRIWAAGGDAKIENTPQGRGFYFDGTDDYFSYTGYPEISGNVGTFFIWCPTVGASDQFGHVLIGSASPNAFAPQVSEAGNMVIPGLSGGANLQVSWFNTANTSMVLSYGGTAAAMKVHIRGKNTGTTWSGGSPTAWGAGNKTINIGRYPGGTVWDFSGTMLFVGWTSAIWGGAEAKAFHENPWQIFKAPARRLWATSSGGTSYTLPSDSASFALTGTAANLEYNRLLAATQGSFAVTATAATLKRGYALQSDPGSFALSGTDAALRRDRVSQADSASPQIAGTDANLEYNRVLSADSGSFQIIGTDATFIHDAPGSYTLSAESASFGIAAQPATLKYNRRLQADSGSFAFTGSAASLRYARAVIAEASQFAITGTAANLTIGNRPVSAARTYAVPVENRVYAVSLENRTYTVPL